MRLLRGLSWQWLRDALSWQRRPGVTDRITLTGGCAKNAGLKKAIEHVLKVKVIDLDVDPQLMGALGAAEYARSERKKIKSYEEECCVKTCCIQKHGCILKKILAVSTVAAVCYLSFIYSIWM